MVIFFIYNPVLSDSFQEFGFINQTQIWYGELINLYTFNAKNCPQITRMFNLKLVLIELTKPNLSLKCLLSLG